ncbi:MAG: glycerate kinase [Bacteroidota bacterium]
MKILIAPDKFKGSLSAEEVCEAIKTGILAMLPDAEVIILPLADGGEGFSEAIIGSHESKKIELTVNDPLNRWKSANYFILDNTIAIIEMANASGLKLLSSSERNPLKASTLGTGELIRNAIENGAKEIIIGIGGSATNDAGMGMAAALGYRFLDKNESVLNPSGENMIKVCQIVEPKSKPWTNIAIKVACDVTNPLYGINGAAHVFAKQKGANAQQIKQLDDGLRQFSRVVNAHFGKQFHFIEGAGAAGGLGYGLLTFLGAELKSGIDLILEANDFEKKLKDVDLVITGEGKMDIQTLSGKVVAGVSKKAKENNIPVYGICGISELTENQVSELGLSKLSTLKSPEISVDYAIKNAKELIVERIKQLL